ncbi:MAG: AMP-binding protein [Deltaproteobacteria bacterium]|nr:AMP-binding protein [Deltaproteobacteria bacterium]
MILFTPDKDQIEHTNFFKFMKSLGKNSPSDFYEWSVRNDEEFWRKFINFAGIKGNFESSFLTDSSDFMGTKFFPQAKISLIKNIKFDFPKSALVYLRDDKKIEITYKDLKILVGRAASWLYRTGTRKLFCILPNRPEAVILFLASQALGITFCITGPESGSSIIRSRILEFKPDVVVTVDSSVSKSAKYSYSDLIDSELLNSLGNPVVVVLNETFETNINLISNSEEIDIMTTHDFNHPMAVLFTSGTTGKPKGLVHSLGGFILENIKELTLHSNLTEHDSLFYYTSTSWMMWYWMLGGLFVGSTIYLYDGDPLGENKLKLWEIVESEDITFFGTSARHIAISQKYWTQSRAFNNLKVIFSTGSPLLEHNFDFVYGKIKSNLMLYSISGGTDIIGCFALGCPILPIKAGMLQIRSLTYSVDVLDENGKSTIGQPGELVCLKPMMSKPLALLNDNNNQRLLQTYFSKFANIWNHGDYAILFEDGYMKILGRSDATLKPSGVRIGTAEIYEVVENVEGVVEALAASKKDEDENDNVVLFVVIQEGFDFEKVQESIIEEIKKRLSKFHVPKFIFQLSAIPKTKNNKPIEILVTKLLNEATTSNLSDLGDEKILDEILKIKAILKNVLFKAKNESSDKN